MAALAADRATGRAHLFESIERRETLDLRPVPRRSTQFLGWSGPPEQRNHASGAYCGNALRWLSHAESMNGLPFFAPVPLDRRIREEAAGGDCAGPAHAAGNGSAPLRSAVPPELAGTNGRPADPRVSVVIPALNEAKNLPHVFAELPDDIFEIVLVDGHSVDGTAEVARALYPNVRIVGQTGRGKGNALACGFAACRGDVIVMLDGDGSANAAEIPSFVRALRNGADFAKGSRFLDGGGSSDITYLRHFGNWFFRQLVNVLHRTRYSDLCYGYNAFWSDCLPVIDLDCDGFEAETLINIRAANGGLRITEVPSFERERIHGESNLRPFRDGYRVLRTIFREWRRKASARDGCRDGVTERLDFTCGRVAPSEPPL